ncbi:zinc finger CCHC domain-containing protein 9-like [Lineus longissimus]|uniref:zinc finger CCHC domain-containing protein 9-like n=1 Tax=Lineus longissimus TaxID=88925 RepID=UPI002B4C71CD
MTRWARGGTANKKKPHEASQWSELKTSQSGDRQSGRVTKHAKRKSTSHQKEKLDKDTAEEMWRKKEERRENRRVKRIDVKEKQAVCFNCRKSGHTIAECPQRKNDMEHGVGICFKCGSTEHTVTQCRLKLPPGSFPYAKCFICKEQGHLSKQCPDNPKGLYPMGGCCRLCGSVEHFKKDCPDLQRSKGVGDATVERIHTLASADAEPSLIKSKFRPPVKKGSKVVMF